MNKVILMGNLGRDPEVKEFDNGGSVTKFPVATSRKYKNRDGELVEDTTWHEVEVSGNSADACAKYLSKGSKVLVEGSIAVRKYEKDGEKRSFTSIRAQRVDFVSTKAEGGDDRGNAPANTDPSSLPF